MREKVKESFSDPSEGEYKRPNSDTSLVAHEIELKDGQTPPEQAVGSEICSVNKREDRMVPGTPRPQRKRSTTDPKTDELSDRKRSLSLNSVDNIKASKTGPVKLPFLMRLSRPWSRRLSSAS